MDLELENRLVTSCLGYFTSLNPFPCLQIVTAASRDLTRIHIMDIQPFKKPHLLKSPSPCSCPAHKEDAQSSFGLQNDIKVRDSKDRDDSSLKYS